MKVLVIRPAADAARTARALAERGHEAILAPVLTIRFCPAEIPDTPVQAVLLTSANAARALAAHPNGAGLRSALVLAVGERTAEAARSAGFRSVEAASGTAEALQRLVPVRLDPARGPLLYPSGRDVASDLGPALAGAGFEVLRVVVYEAAAADALPHAAESALQRREVDAALAYSPRSARLLAELAARAGLQAELAALPVICLSQAVADAARAAGAGRLAVASAPDEQALFDALDGLGR